MDQIDSGHTAWVLVRYLAGTHANRTADDSRSVMTASIEADETS